LCYTQINVEQDHNFDGDGCRASHGFGGSRRAIVHPLQRAGSKSLSVKLLRQQDVLRDIAKQDSSVVAAACSIRFQLQAERDMRRVGSRSFAGLGIWRSTIFTFQCRV
jgi:hypothetical protein